MGSYRKYLAPYAAINAVSMATSITGDPVNLQYLDNLAAQFIWTGTPTGSFVVEASLDYNSNLGTGTWNVIPGLALLSPAGSASSFLLNLTLLALPWIRIRYVASSGTGSLTVYVAAKGS